MAVRPVILSGGSGTRMWPVSRLRLPKQFADLYGDMCLFARTLDMVSDRKFFAPPIIIANVEHKFLVLDILAKKKITDAVIVLEPEGRNTAAAAMVAALIDKDSGDDYFHLVLPSDHVITEREVFLNLVQETKGARDRFVLFGITPHYPETGFGYIVADKLDAPAVIKPIKKFVEKPPEDVARNLIADGALWNSGIFFYAPQLLCREAESLAPETLVQCAEALQNSAQDLGCTILAVAPYARISKQPFDKLIMERTQKGSVIAGDFGWSDVGTWNALWQISDKDADGTVAEGRVVTHDVRSSYIRSYGPAVAVMGVENLTVVATKDAVLVMPLAQSQNVRELVTRLDALDATLAVEHPRVQRPWGAYEGIAEGDRFRVKSIKVLPSRALSRQKHFHRAEHWVVVAGTAKVECDGVETLVYPNQSVFIPQGAVHRLSNPGHVDLHLVEVQTGDYVGEDDIVRFADDYNRA